MEDSGLIMSYTERFNKFGLYRNNLNTFLGIAVQPTDGGSDMTVEQLFEKYKHQLSKDNTGTKIYSGSCIFEVSNDKQDYEEAREDVYYITNKTYTNVHLSIDMDYYHSLKGEESDGYLTQCFINHCLFLATYKDLSENFYKDLRKIKIYPLCHLQIDKYYEIPLTWPIYSLDKKYNHEKIDDYYEKCCTQEINGSDYLDLEKFLSSNKDAILISVMAGLEVSYLLPLTRSYFLKEYTNNIHENIFYECPESMQTALEIRPCNIFLLSPYFLLSGIGTNLFINARDLMMILFSKEQVFCLKKEKVVKFTSSINAIENQDQTNFFGTETNINGSHHCQEKTDKTIHRVFISKITDFKNNRIEEKEKAVELNIEEIYDKYSGLENIINYTQRKEDAMDMVDKTNLEIRAKFREFTKFAIENKMGHIEKERIMKEINSIEVKPFHYNPGFLMELDSIGDSLGEEEEDYGPLVRFLEDYREQLDQSIEDEMYLMENVAYEDIVELTSDEAQMVTRFRERLETPDSDSDYDQREEAAHQFLRNFREYLRPEDIDENELLDVLDDDSLNIAQLEMVENFMDRINAT